MQAHQTAIKACSDSPSATVLINYGVFMYNTDKEANKEKIVQLLMEFEKLWLKRKANSNEFEENIMKMATILATLLNLSNHVSWMKELNNNA